MEAYIGTKLINAKAMNRLEYNKFRGWELPKDENGTDEGYLVEYTDGGEVNTSEYEGYVSWSPKNVFEKAYKASGELSFGAAIELLKQGRKVARKGWNDMFLFLDTSSTFNVNNPPQPCIIMKTADGRVVPWLASQSDMLDTGWVIIS